ncbi:TenA family protein [Danxiaibacter flavus]|uniref:TenA family protein n=1 Tax=Danxiaibacter flavus TaxID=3049108 RepID=A0ABV3ZAK4_9BACT|nr:TenA family protein [Chitinophagaceae bacterium DXS]
MNWSEHAWNSIEQIYEKILDMPFNKELMAGTLTTERFRFYMMQDAHYLSAFSKVLAIIASKLPSAESLDFIRFAEGAVVVERALHENYFSAWQVSEIAEISPTCQLYTDHLFRRAYLDSVEVAIAAVLPCFWIYKKVGDHIYANQQKENNPYQQWIDTYAGEEFAISVKRAIAIADEKAAQLTPTQQQAMTEAFVKTTKMEWMFWDSAYGMERWKV